MQLYDILTALWDEIRVEEAMIRLKESNLMIGGPGKVVVIAEAGYNHDGSLSEAKKLILEAKKAGADVVKFQIVHADRFVPKNLPRSKDEEKTMAQGDDLYQELKRAELPDEAYIALMELARENGILMTASFTEKETVDFLVRLGVPFVKIGSGELTNLPFLRYVAEKNLPLILSTGMATLEEVETAVKTVLETGNQNLCLLHCTSRYPTDPADANLRAIKTLKETFPSIPVGYSDHTLGLLAPIVAVSLGAVVIEKHFTLDKTKPGADHSTSLEPDEFAEMVEAIRKTEVLLGSPVKTPCRAEEEMRILARRSLVVQREMRPGEIFTENSIEAMRPATGLPPSFWSRVIGKRAKKRLTQGEVLTLEKIEW